VIQVAIRNGTTRAFLVNRLEGHINILKEFAGSDAKTSTRELDEVVTRHTTMFAPERIGEVERGSELFCPDQKSGAISLPFIVQFLHHVHPSGEGELVRNFENKFVLRDANVRA